MSANGTEGGGGEGGGRRLVSANGTEGGDGEGGFDGLCPYVCSNKTANWSGTNSKRCTVLWRVHRAFLDS